MTPREAGRVAALLAALFASGGWATPAGAQEGGHAPGLQTHYVVPVGEMKDVAKASFSYGVHYQYRLSSPLALRGEYESAPFRRNNSTLKTTISSYNLLLKWILFPKREGAGYTLGGGDRATSPFLVAGTSRNRRTEKANGVSTSVSKSGYLVGGGVEATFRESVRIGLDLRYRRYTPEDAAASAGLDLSWLF